MDTVLICAGVREGNVYPFFFDVAVGHDALQKHFQLIDFTLLAGIKVGWVAAPWVGYLRHDRSCLQLCWGGGIKTANSHTNTFSVSHVCLPTVYLPWRVRVSTSPSLISLLLKIDVYANILTRCRHLLQICLCKPIYKLGLSCLWLHCIVFGLCVIFLFVVSCLVLLMLRNRQARERETAKKKWVGERERERHTYEWNLNLEPN
jgi:hypothetical protein